MLVMGQGLISPARALPEAHVFWKAWSPTFGEGPKPEQAQSLTFGEGSENPSFFTAVHSVKFQGPAFLEELKPGPDSSKPGLGPGSTFQGPTHQ